MKYVGILGGGQLAQLLVSKAKKARVKTVVLSPSKTDPAKLNSKHQLQIKANKKTLKLTQDLKKPVQSVNASYGIQGDPNNISDLKNLAQCVDVLTFESEFFCTSQIQKAIKNTDIKVYPSLENLKHIQDRWLQKKLLKQYEIPTLDFKTVTFKNKKDQTEKLLNLWNQWGAFVLKTRKGGYDGYGTFTFKNKQTLQKIKLPKHSFIAEKFISFKRELALLSARNQKGQIVFFPLVESFQKNSICHWVKGPATHKKLTAFKKQIKVFLQQIDYQGVIAFELFDIDSKLIVNELAPRVHNTGHYSLDALTEDQFSMHLKAVSNQNLKTPRLNKKSFAMLNLLGEGAKKPLFKTQNLAQSHNEIKKQGGILYWYGKSENRIGRKMGHLNTTAVSGKQALNKLMKIKKNIKL